MRHLLFTEECMHADVRACMRVRARYRENVAVYWCETRKDCEFVSLCLSWAGVTGCLSTCSLKCVSVVTSVLCVHPSGVKAQ